MATSPRPAAPAATPPSPPTPPASPSRHGPSFEPVRTYPALYAQALVALALAYLVLGLFAHQLWVIGLVHFITGVRIIPRDSIAGALVLGYPTHEFTQGIVVAPVGIFRLPVYPLAPIDIRVPRDPSKVYRGEDMALWPAGWEEPIRVPFAARNYKDILPFKAADGTELMGADELKSIIHEDDPLLMRGTQEVSFFVRLVIKQGTASDEYGFFDFYVRIGSYSNARRQVKEMVIAKIFEDFTKVSMAEALAILEDFNENLERHLCDVVKSWGVDVPTAKVTLQFTKSLNESILSIPRAKAEAKSTELKAQGEKKRLALEGEGRGAALKAELEGKGKGQKKQMAELGITDANVVIGAEVADAIAKGNNEKIILVGGDGILNLASSLTQRLGGPKP